MQPLHHHPCGLTVTAQHGPEADFPTPSIGSPLPQGRAGQPYGSGQAPQAMPRSFEVHGGMPEDAVAASPFFREANPFRTPDPRNPKRGSNLTYPGESAWAGGKPSIFEISRKPNDRLFVFTQDAKYFRLWRDRFVDHFCRSTQKWRQLLEFVQVGTTPISKSWLQSTNVSGVNAWDLSTMLEAFLVDYFPKGMYNRRVQLAGGQMGNGLEMWRLLFVEYQGGSEAVQFGGIRRLQEFPK